MLVIFKATCIGLFMLISHALSHKGAHDCNVGTVLFSRSDLNRSRWRLGEIKLLKARSFFQTVLPPALNMTMLDIDSVNQFFTFFKTANSSLKTENVDFETNQIVTAAFSDAFGGYLKTSILPSVKHSYYSGTISQENVTNMYGIYDRLKKYLNTDGGGWRKPRTRATKHKVNKETLYTYVPQTSPGIKVGKRKNPCGDLAFLEKTEDGFTVPIPRVNWQSDISTLWVPLKLPTLFSMDSTNGSAALIEYYGKAKDCLEIRSPDLLKNFQDRFQCWLDSDVLPHLTDDRLYFALGSVLTLVKGAQSRKADNKVNIKGKYTSFMKTFHLPVEWTSKKTLIIVLISIELLWFISALCCIWLSRRRKRNSSSNVFVGPNSYDRNSNSKGQSRFESERRTSYVLDNLHSLSTSVESFDKRSDVKILYQRRNGDVNSKHAPRMFLEAETKCSTPKHASKDYKRFLNRSSPRGANTEYLAAKSNITAEPQSYSLKPVSASDKDVFNHSKKSKHSIDNIEKHTINSKIRLQKSYTTKHHQIMKANDESFETIIKHKSTSNIFKGVSESSEIVSKQHSPSKFKTKVHNINNISKYRLHNSDIEPALYHNYGNKNSLRKYEPPLSSILRLMDPIYYSESKPDAPVILDSTNAVSIHSTLPNTYSLSTVITEKEENQVPNSECKHVNILAPVRSDLLNRTLIDTPSPNANDLTNPVIQKNKKHVRISEIMTEVRSNIISSSLQKTVNNAASYKTDTRVTDARSIADERMLSNDCSNTLYQKPFKSVSIMEPADIKSIHYQNTEHDINSDSSNSDIPKSISKPKRNRKRSLKRFVKPLIDKDETSSTNTDITKEYPATEVSDMTMRKSRKHRKRTVRQSVRPLKLDEGGSNVRDATRRTENQRSFNTLQDKNKEIPDEISRDSRETVLINDIVTKVDQTDIKPRSIEHVISYQHEVERSINNEDNEPAEDCASGKDYQNIFYLTEPDIIESHFSPYTTELTNHIPLQTNLESSVAPEEESVCKKYTSKELLLDKNKHENHTKRRMRWEITVIKPEKDVVDIQGKIKIPQQISKIPKRTLPTRNGQKTPSHLCKGQSLIPRLKKIVADDIALCTKDNAVPNKLNTTI